MSYNRLYCWHETSCGHCRSTPGHHGCQTVSFCSLIPGRCFLRNWLRGYLCCLINIVSTSVLVHHMSFLEVGRWIWIWILHGVFEICLPVKYPTSSYGFSPRHKSSNNDLRGWLLFWRTTHCDINVTLDVNFSLFLDLHTGKIFLRSQATLLGSTTAIHAKFFVTRRKISLRDLLKKIMVLKIWRRKRDSHVFTIPPPREVNAQRFFRPLVASLHWLGFLDLPARKCDSANSPDSPGIGQCIVKFCRVSYLALMWTWTAFMRYAANGIESVITNIQHRMTYNNFYSRLRLFFHQDFTKFCVLSVY